MKSQHLKFPARPAALAAALALLAASAWADPPARVGRVAWIAGDVSLAAQPGDAPSAAALNWPVTSGNVLVTSSSGRAEVTIGGTALDLDVNTEVDVEQLDDAQMRFRVQRGSVAVRATDPQDVRMLAVQTPQGRFTPQQTGRWRVDVGQGATDGTAWRGRLGFVGNDNATFTFVDGQHVRLTPGPNGLAMTLMAADADDFQRFAQARTGAPAQGVAARYVPPTMTGVDTLDSYGLWTTSADYGTVWVPSVAADWAPYRYGRWAWVSPWGWTWVDDAPWGFAPFHYGRWALWEGRWAWVPGSYVARPVYAPALVAWTSPLPPAPRVSVGVGIGIGAGFAAGVSWVPLAPREVYVPPYSVSNTYVRNVNITHVTNVTEIENVTRVVHAQGEQRPNGAAFSARPLALAGNPRAETHVATQVMLAHQPVAGHLPPAAAPAPGFHPAPRPVAQAPIAPRGERAAERGGEPPPARQPMPLERRMDEGPRQPRMESGHERHAAPVRERGREPEGHERGGERE